MRSLQRLPAEYWWLGAGGSEPSTSPSGAVFVEQVAPRPPSPHSTTPSTQGAPTSAAHTPSRAHTQASAPAGPGCSHTPSPEQALPASEAAPAGWGGIYHTVAQLDALLAWLNPRGVREAALRLEVQRCRDLMGLAQAAVGTAPERGRGRPPLAPASAEGASGAEAGGAAGGAGAAVAASLLPPPPAAMLQQTALTRATGKAAAAAATAAAAAAAAAASAAAAEQEATAAVAAAAAAAADWNGNGPAEGAAPPPAAAAARFTRTQLAREPSPAPAALTPTTFYPAAVAPAAPREPGQCASLRGQLLELYQRLAEQDTRERPVFRPFWGSAHRQSLWRALADTASAPSELSAAVTLLEGMVRSTWLLPHLRLCGSPAQHPAMAGTWAAVAYRLGMLVAAVKTKGPTAKEVNRDAALRQTPAQRQRAAEAALLLKGPAAGAKQRRAKAAAAAGSPLVAAAPNYQQERYPRRGSVEAAAAGPASKAKEGSESSSEEAEEGEDEASSDDEPPPPTTAARGATSGRLPPPGSFQPAGPHARPQLSPTSGSTRGGMRERSSNFEEREYESGRSTRGSRAREEAAPATLKMDKLRLAKTSTTPAAGGAGSGSKRKAVDLPAGGGGGGRAKLSRPVQGVSSGDEDVGSGSAAAEESGSHDGEGEDAQSGEDDSDGGEAQADDESDDSSEIEGDASEDGDAENGKGTRANPGKGSGGASAPAGGGRETRGRAAAAAAPPQPPRRTRGSAAAAAAPAARRPAAAAAAQQQQRGRLQKHAQPTSSGDFDDLNDA
ncbi:MAG: hypothetical protein WDW36_004156 [Sanguina aurantia]